MNGVTRIERALHGPRTTSGGEVFDVAKIRRLILDEVDQGRKPFLLEDDTLSSRAVDDVVFFFLDFGKAQR